MGNITAMDNSAMMGGVIYGTDDASIIIANGSTFDGNMASSHGGAVACVDCASLTLLGVSMTANQADLIGGALYAQASAALELEDVQYIGNWYASTSVSWHSVWATPLQSQSLFQHAAHNNNKKQQKKKPSSGVMKTILTVLTTAVLVMIMITAMNGSPK